MDQQALDDAYDQEVYARNRDFAATVTVAGKSAQLIVGTGYNHFELLETLANPYSLLGRAMLEPMRLAPNQGGRP